MILVTGGTGLVGSHLLFDLVSKGKKVRALKRKTSNTQLVRQTFGYYSEIPDELFNRIEWLDGDMLDSFSLEDALVGIGEVYHCAALVSFRKSDRKSMQDINVKGTRNLVNACLDANIRKFCMVSSVAALGTPAEGENTVTENTPWRPEDKRSAYSISKFNSELEVWRGIEEGLDAVIVNPSVILGPGQWNKGSSLLFSTVAKGLKYYTKGITGYVDVRDVSKTMIQLMESDIVNERFILNSEDCTYEFIFKTIAKYLGIAGPTKYANRKMTEIGWRLASLQKVFLFKQSGFTKETARAAHNVKYFTNQKIKNSLDFEFIPIEQSITDMAKHYPKSHAKEAKN
ncbi:NAD-dependent epimerase/dehydratase family protein [Ancylomarina longa]|uniref:NAD-dependent epimerase/dehydratase family protein n=1 Tax=Ancylomarina longa TaxID=2487017 RepID=A0A434ATT3_9BACT|nr:NAD-dependent epimerase/dehydratase family protein [Ancylomarina longa]RUT77744.1 NAD-dependent epimerase/dehydratase family protein [Ancylomarina longa]